MECPSLRPYSTQNVLSTAAGHSIPILSDNQLERVQIIREIRPGAYFGMHGNTPIFVVFEYVHRDAFEQMIAQHRVNVHGAWYNGNHGVALLNFLPDPITVATPSSPVRPTVLPSILPSLAQTPTVSQPLSSPTRPTVLPSITSILPTIATPVNPTILQVQQSATKTVIPPLVVTGEELACTSQLEPGPKIPTGFRVTPQTVRIPRTSGDPVLIKVTDQWYNDWYTTIFKVTASGDHRMLMQVMKYRVHQAACVQDMVARSEYHLALPPVQYWPSRVEGSTGGAILSNYNGEQTLYNWLRGTTRDMRTAYVLIDVITAVCNLNINLEIAHGNINAHTVILSRTPTSVTDANPIRVKFLDFARAVKNNEIMVVDYPSLLASMKKTVGGEGQSVIQKLLTCLPTSIGGGNTDAIITEISNKLAMCIPKEKPNAKPSNRPTWKTVSVGGAKTPKEKTIRTPREKKEKKPRNVSKKKNNLCDYTALELACGENFPEFTDRLTQNAIDKIIIADEPLSDENGIKKYRGTMGKTNDEIEVIVSIGNIERVSACLQNAMYRSGHAVELLAFWQCTNGDHVRISKSTEGKYTPLTSFVTLRRNEWLLRELYTGLVHMLTYMNLEYGASRKIDINDVFVSVSGNAILVDYDVPFKKSNGIDSLVEGYDNLVGAFQKLLRVNINNNTLRYAGDARRVLGVFPKGGIQKIYDQSDGKRASDVMNTFKEYVNQNYHDEAYEFAEFFETQHNNKDNFKDYPKVNVEWKNVILLDALYPVGTVDKGVKMNTYSAEIRSDDHRPIPILITRKALANATSKDLKAMLDEPDIDITVMDYWRDPTAMYIVFSRPKVEEDEPEDESEEEYEESDEE